MSTEPFALVPKDLLKDKVPASAVVVYALLAASVNAQDAVPASWLSMRTIAGELSMDRSTVSRDIAALIKAKWLVEVPEEDWLPRWKDALGDRLQPVRVLSLPKHPKKQQQDRNERRRQARGQQKAAKEKAESQRFWTEKRKFYEAATEQYLATGDLNGYGGRDTNLEVAIRRGKITDDVSATTWIDQQIRDRDRS